MVDDRGSILLEPDDALEIPICIVATVRAERGIDREGFVEWSGCLCLLLCCGQLVRGDNELSLTLCRRLAVQWDGGVGK